MPLCLGIDTGGTYTDAALVDLAEDGHKGEVVAKAKALTTRQNLAIGISEAAKNALGATDISPASIALVSLSTTLATNALVEGQGGRVCLIAIGFEPRDLEKAGLAEALGNDPVIHIRGGHTTHGQEVAPLDLEGLHEALSPIAGEVSGFAIAGYFAVRNPAHELAVRDFVLEKTGAAVTCSHELSARLNGPKRALTTVLNARLVPMITRLIEATRSSLAEMNIDAPIMVVRGDGALVGSDFASRRPIETILSGPAASLVGASFLTGEQNAWVCDIGGTTSDVALISDGKPKLDEDGALVGGYRTMVEAVAMHTFGLGGDSEISIGGTALKPRLELGPRRLVPVSLIASQYPKPVHSALDRQIKSTLNGRHDGRFALLSGMGLAEGLPGSQAKLLARLSDQPVALDELLSGNSEAAALNALVARGLVLLCGLTPSDALHRLDLHDAWDTEAADKALRLFARQRVGSGQSISPSADMLATEIKRRVERRSAEVVLQTAFEHDGRDGANLISHELVRAELDRHQSGEGKENHVSLALTLDAPLIGLGASAFQYHPGAASILATKEIIPDHADVANAIGAVVGHIGLKAEVLITQPGEGRYAVSGIDQPFASQQIALSSAENLARDKIARLAEEAGAGEIEIRIEKDLKRAEVEGRDVLVEATVRAIATGRPPLVKSGQEASEGK